MSLLAAGGTISMTAERGAGATPALDGAALAAAAGVEVSASTIASRPSVHLTFADALEIARAAVAEAGRGAGVVVTTGTDTMEELAVLCDAVNGADRPVVFTGAIRTASAASADGPANLADAVAVAAQAPGGTYVAFGGEVHAAREVRKADSTSPLAFASPRTGPLGYVTEGRVSLHAPAPRSEPLAVERTDLYVPIVPTWLGDDGRLLRAALGLRPDGLVLVALGAGHVSPAVLGELAVAACPVAVTVRPERGAMLRSTYGFEGAEGDVLATGAIPAATRSPQAARVLLVAALGAGLRGDALAAAAGDPA
ncbi:MAG TPA: asparaginase domain-containing protein [Solirubrobacteraceae bacterium]|nr:asparaginase domain-containing protein [Solirubrobacteraceae bacterium]